MCTYKIAFYLDLDWGLKFYIRAINYLNLYTSISSKIKIIINKKYVSMATIINGWIKF